MGTVQRAALPWAEMPPRLKSSSRTDGPSCADEPIRRRHVPERLPGAHPTLPKRSTTCGHRFDSRVSIHKNAGVATQKPWQQTRGFERLLQQETNISDLLQFLSDRDPVPWQGLVGFVPTDVIRESRASNRADLHLTEAAGPGAIIEVKLAHAMNVGQQHNYEELTGDPRLFLAALAADRVRLKESTSDRWRFLSLGDVTAAWTASPDEPAAVVATQMTQVLTSWDDLIDRVLLPVADPRGLRLNALRQKFLARVITRRVASDLTARGFATFAGVTSGGGLPLVQAWTPVRGHSLDRCFMTEVRWWETKPGGELRFGVDFAPGPGQQEDESVRRAAFDLARSMNDAITFESLRAGTGADLRWRKLLARKGSSRPKAKGDWERVIQHGVTGSPLDGGVRNTRSRTKTGFFGDGALRFQAIAEVDFTEASAPDLVDLIAGTLGYLSAHQPAGEA